jgi:pyrroline-5-carboxylate reductase
MRLQIIGGGKMGEALLGGMIDTGWASPDELCVVEAIADRRADLAGRFVGVSVAEQVMGGVDAIVAVKPDAVVGVCRALAAAGVHRVLSIAAGVTLAKLEGALAPGTAVVRAMPNTPALVGRGAAAISGGTHAGAEDRAWARSILDSVGTVEVLDESLLDAVTGLSGSGPAYLFLLAEALIDAGVAAGLPHDVSVRLTEQTLLGSATLLVHAADPPEVLRRNVTSPGGTTAAGLAVFDAADFRGLVTRVVQAATDRSRELGAG